MPFYDYSLKPEQWQEMPGEEKRLRQINIRSYFLYKNGFPGSDEERYVAAEFAHQFNHRFYQMECRRSAQGTPQEEVLLLVLQEQLCPILRLPPQDITLSTKLPNDPRMLVYLRNRVNYETHIEFTEDTFQPGETLKSLIAKLKTVRPFWSRR